MDFQKSLSGFLDLFLKIIIVLLKQEVLKLFTYLEQKSENASRQIVHVGYVKPK